MSKKPPRARKNPMRPYDRRAAAPSTDTQKKLSEEQKIQVVQRLAGFHSKVAIIGWLREEHGITISRKGVAYYDPTTYAGRRLVERWKTLFFETRKAIREGRVEIGAANKMVRVRWLDAMARDAMDEREFKVAAQLLAQTAKEVGDTVPDRQKHEHSDISDAEFDRRLGEAAAALGLVRADAGKPPGA